jgi:alkaline phosphatase D
MVNKDVLLTALNSILINQSCLKQNNNYLIRFLYIFLFLLPVSMFGQNALLQCGPMVGYADHEKVLLWVQTTAQANVKFKYWEKDKPSGYQYTIEDSTTRGKSFTVKIIADRLLAGRTYNYELYLNGELIKINYPLQFKTLATDLPDTFKVALGSCAVDSHVDDVNQIFLSIAEKKPDAMIWLGDNVYLDRSECVSKELMMNGYTRSMSRSQIQPLLGSVHNYAVWDDHDFGPDNSDSTFCNKKISREVFEQFWGNPSFGVDGQGITTVLNFPDVDFYLMDNRSMRAPNSQMKRGKPYLGEKQLKWLFDSLKTSKASFKFITLGNQILPTGLIIGETYGKYKREHNYLLKKIKKEKIQGVFFISGDRHFTELSKKKRRHNYPLYDLTVSPLTSAPITHEFNINIRREKGTYVGERNFAMMEFYNNSHGRQVRIGLYNSKGMILWQKIIAAADLTKPSK